MTSPGTTSLSWQRQGRLSLAETTFGSFPPGTFPGDVISTHRGFVDRKMSAVIDAKLTITDTHRRSVRRAFRARLGSDARRRAGGGGRALTRRILQLCTPHSQRANPSISAAGPAKRQPDNHTYQTSAAR